MTSQDSLPSRGPFPVAAGLVILYAGLFQIGVALPMLVQAFSYSFEPALALPAASLIVSQLGQIGMGYFAAANRSVTISLTVWIVGCVGMLYSLTRLEVANVEPIVVGVLQLAGGPVTFALVARNVPVARTPARREIGAALLVITIGHVFGTVWSFVSMVRMFGIDAITVRAMLAFGVTPTMTLIASVLALRAARSLLDGRASAQRDLALWKWVSIGASSALAVLSVVSFVLDGHDLPLAFMIQPLLQAMVACVLPLAVDRLGRGALAEPIEPKDIHAVPTVYAWAALWFVPTLACASVVTRMTFARGLVDNDADSRLAIISACCGLAAALLLATSLCVLRTVSIARTLARLTATLAFCTLCYLIVVVLQTKPRDYTSNLIPLGPVAVFTAAMIALAWFEARREKDLAPARIV